MKLAKKLLAMAVVLAMVLGLTTGAAFERREARVVVDGVEVQFVGQGAFIEGGRVFAPARGVFTQMGFEIDWDAANRVATLHDGSFLVVIPADGAHFYVNDEVIVPDVAQFMLEGRIMLPVSAIARVVNATPNWYPATMTATITTAGYVPADDDDNGDDAFDCCADDHDDEDYNDDDDDADDEDDADNEDANGDDDNNNDDEAPHAIVGGMWVIVSDYYDDEITFNADGTGTVYDLDFSEGFTWYIVDGVLVIVFDEDGYVLELGITYADGVLTLYDLSYPDDYAVFIRK